MSKETTQAETPAPEAKMMGVPEELLKLTFSEVMDPPPPAHMVGANEEYLRGYSDAIREGSEEREWMTHKAWMDAVLMLVHYTDNAKRTWLVGHEEAARKRDEWWDRCRTLAATKSAEDVEALPSPQTNLSVPKGYVLVPIKPTKQMAHEAACYFYGSKEVAQAGGIEGISMQNRNGDPTFWMAFKKFWKAALAHAPQPSEPAPPQTRAMGTDTTPQEER